MDISEKYALILEPILLELAPYGYFRRGTEVCYVNRHSKYAVVIHPELMMRGTYKCIWVKYGSFYSTISAGRSPDIALGESLLIGSEILPFDTCCFETSDDLADICRRSATVFVCYFKENVSPILKEIRDFNGYIAACEALQSLRPFFDVSPKRAWDYLVIGQRQKAYAYLDGLVSRSWQEHLWQTYQKKNDHEKKKMEEAWQGLADRACLNDEIMSRIAKQCSELKEQLQALSDKELHETLDSRTRQSEQKLEKYFGVRRWRTFI